MLVDLLMLEARDMRARILSAEIRELFGMVSEERELENRGKTLEQVLSEFKQR